MMQRCDKCNHQGATICVPSLGKFRRLSLEGGIRRTEGEDQEEEGKKREGEEEGVLDDGMESMKVEDSVQQHRIHPLINCSKPETRKTIKCKAQIKVVGGGGV